jgi:hypothetical protein
MKVLCVVAALVLSSCASDGQFRTSTTFNGQSFGSMDLTNPHFYIDDDARPTAGSAAAVPAVPHYGIDGYCGYCQRRGS